VNCGNWRLGDKHHEQCRPKESGGKRVGVNADTEEPIQVRKTKAIG
jgi:hypothetical protein